jgi:hypothetical protein
MNTPSLLLSLELFDSEKARKDENNAETFVICDDKVYTCRGNPSPSKLEGAGGVCLYDCGNIAETDGNDAETFVIYDDD